MPKRLPEEDLAAIVDAVALRSEGARVGEIANVLKSSIPRRTLQYWLKHLVDAERLVKEGEGRWAKYHVPAATAPEEAAPARAAEGAEEGEVHVPLSPASTKIRDYLREPAAGRNAVGYNRQFLDGYRPNESFYLSGQERAHLAEVGRTNAAVEAAGTYARKILARLLIDLSWNSSRLEGNTYSLLDTRRLIEFGEEAEGGNRVEAQMIINHKDAIGFLVGAAEEIGFNRYTILNLHGILAHNLLPDKTAAGRLRHIAVGIEKSAFHPLEVPQMIEECFNQILATAAAIKDPFEQSFFVMVQLPYLQPFDDVNKRVSRLAANIPFIKGNLSPLSFTGVPRSTYTEAMLGVYELNKADLLKDVFMGAYERSAARYIAVRQSLGEPDPFRLRHRAALRQVVGEVVRERMGRKAAVAHIGSWAEENIPPGDRERFRETAETEVLNLHEGNFARYEIRPSEFEAWRAVWTDSATAN
ncbi:MAG TPA: Fic family protein [Edaphobacter sp.]|uniref:Fic family protein n=1 Tax=Edaphobacter sp. TaxID=1934404 RepID=UPI002BACE3BD|nr:Fic family protein [Edaphobacter sp.]HUZ96850.1 Fic family protein [Edaphobacter sp.]